MSTYAPIQAITLTSTASSVEFTGIPQNFTDLVLVSNTIGTAALYALRLNADTSSLYSRTRMVGDGTSATSSRQSSQGDIIIDNLSSTNWSMSTIHLMNYANTTTNKTILARTGTAATDTAAVVGLYRSTAPITSIRLYMASNSFTSGSTFTLYGIASGAPKAFGGDVVVNDGTYWYHAFRSSGRFEPYESLNADILVVAGGGGGSLSSASGGGAGAGGLLVFTNENLSASPHTVTVGAGGVGCSSNNTGTVFQVPTNGNNSRFGNLTLVIGGGTGGGFGVGSNAGNSGGSGGGGATNSGAGGSGTAGQGNSGGTAGNGGSFWSGSGGGAGAAGSFGSGAVAGGIGATSSLLTAMGNATGTGQLSGGNRYYAGGGGNSSNGVGGGAGGLGGGGAGAPTNGVGGSPGQANTGGGAGAGPNATSTLQTGGNGGSGIVIVRYAV